MKNTWLCAFSNYWGGGGGAALFKLCLQGTSIALVHRRAVCHSLIFCEDISHKILTTCKTVLWYLLIQNGAGTEFAVHSMELSLQFIQQIKMELTFCKIPATAKKMTLTVWLSLPRRFLGPLCLTENLHIHWASPHAIRCSSPSWAKWSWTVFLLKLSTIQERRMLLSMERGELPPVIIVWACWTDETGHRTKPSCWHLE